MKRLLAWVTLYCSEIALEIVMFIVGLLFSLAGLFVSEASAITFIIVYTLFGGALLWLLYLPFVALFPAITRIVERINGSKTGLRYTIFGCINILWSARCFLAIAFGANKFTFLSVYSPLVYLAFGIFMVASGKGIKEAQEKRKRAEIEEAAIERYKAQNQ